MRKSIHSAEYQRVLEKLVAMRRNAGLTQRGLAARLNREQSFVWRIETGERRLDVVEFFWVCTALGQDAAKAYAEIANRFLETANGKNHSRGSASPAAEPKSAGKS